MGLRLSLVEALRAGLFGILSNDVQGFRLAGIIQPRIKSGQRNLSGKPRGDERQRAGYADKMKLKKPLSRSRKEAFSSGF
jgi:hypothetical protein